MATYTMFAAIFAIAIGLSFLGNGGEYLQFDDRAGKAHYAAEYQPDLIRFPRRQAFYWVSIWSFRRRSSRKCDGGRRNAEQVHNFKVLMLENTGNPISVTIVVLVVCGLFSTLPDSCVSRKTASHVNALGAGYAMPSRQQRPLPSRYCGAVPVCGNAGGGLVVHHPSGAGVEVISMSAMPQPLWFAASPAFFTARPTF